MNNNAECKLLAAMREREEIESRFVSHIEFMDMVKEAGVKVPPTYPLLDELRASLDNINNRVWMLRKLL